MSFMDTHPYIHTHIYTHRPVNDLAWAPDLPYILATAGEDGAIHLWDVRSHQSPCQSLSAGPNRPAHLVGSLSMYTYI